MEELLHHGGMEALWNGARSDDPLIRESSLRWLARTDPVALLPLLEDSSSPRIRLRARARQPHGEAQLRRAVLDPDARIRYDARATLYVRGHTDLAPRGYRDALAPAAVPDATAIGALGGLADLGSARDVPRILDFTAHPKARVRAEAWRSLGILAPEEVSRRTDRLPPTSATRCAATSLPHPLTGRRRSTARGTASSLRHTGSPHPRCRWTHESARIG
ncbi:MULTISPECIES: hypothetical protein [unclassified Streptomyces]|uniref:hypothetical protein n=1 Tax=unclassified Streptomyces TaxID=2593676 RepID=UPI003394A5A0